MTIATLALLAALAVSAVALGPREYGFEPNYRPSSGCPEDCQVVDQVTGFQVQQLKRRDGDRVTEFPTRVRRRNGWLVAFSLKLGTPRARHIRFFNNVFGRAKARVSVLDPEPPRGDRRNRHQRYRLHNQSEVFDLAPYFGKRAWFVPKHRIHVRRGQVIALTVPTWAPALGIDLSTKEQWRASRNRELCDDTSRQAARQTVGKLRDYRCKYNRARLLFTALVVPKTRENN